MDIDKPALTADPAREDSSPSPCYISSAGPQSRPRYTLKHDDTFVVIDNHGDIGATAGETDGVYCADTRFVSQLLLTVCNTQPLLLGACVRDDNAMLTVDLTNPDIFSGKDIVLKKDALHLVRTIFLWRGTAYQRLSVQNFGDERVEAPITFLYDSDFADLFEVRGVRRLRRGVTTREVLPPDEAALSYRGLDDQERRLILRFDRPPSELSAHAAVFNLVLAPGEAQSIYLSASCVLPGRQPVHKPVTFRRGLLASHRELLLASREGAKVETSNPLFNEVLSRSSADLRMLMTETPEGHYPYAGIPWYSTTFGRDGLITALQLLWKDPHVARGVLRRLAAYQAQGDDPAKDAQPGKILHEMRGGELAALGEVPFGLYYGSVDSTPLFVMLLCCYTERTGDMETLAELWPAAEAALAWIDGPGDPDRDGFIEYQRATGQGLSNQGWKDSEDAVFHADGRLAEGPIALAEVQGYVYAAKILASRCARRLGLRDRAKALRAQANLLAERFDAAFWMPEMQIYALALDGEKQQCKVRTSNAGQVLFSGIARDERAIAVADELMHPRFFSGWGVRTVACGEARYNPMSYHNGSIWPHDNALIALGFARYRLKQSVERVLQAVFDAATYMDLRRLPEVFCGFQRGRGRGPTLYPVACAPQAWASAAPFALLEATLGLEFHPDTQEIRLNNPRLPNFLEKVVIRDLSLGPASVDLVLGRHGFEVSLQVLRAHGPVKVSVVYARR